jgi:hypothetical protein
LEAEGDKLCRMLSPPIATTNSLTFVEIRHQRAGAAGFELRFPQHLAGRLVVGANLLAAAVRRRARDLI